VVRGDRRRPHPAVDLVVAGDVGPGGELAAAKAIERALQQSDLGLNPSNDGTIIRLVIPQLTEDRRKQLVRKVGQHGEEAKISCRAARRDANAMLKDLEKDSDITEDDLTRGLKEVQKRTDDATARVEKIISGKEAELLEL
jgi:ribosome recycling factor